MKGISKRAQQIIDKMLYHYYKGQDNTQIILKQSISTSLIPDLNIDII
ncbi:unnamed protein product [Paramecium sonneborni]|uniref:Uncharacterized protein n=1 Tax=Paramecium sonneborni TaxID=65129 RepID=A0A8S1QEA1_9CILI|nr:unnamed protein product [Paramecium sonneborni]